MIDENHKQQADFFTMMVWKPTTSVAFGIKGRYVYARFCSPRGNQGTNTDYRNNVKKDCKKDGYDNCFMEAALKAHNEKRALHTDS